MGEQKHEGFVGRPRFDALVLATVALGAGGCLGHIGGDGDEDGTQGNPPGQTAEEQVPVSGMRRLTSYEYDATLRELLHDEASGAALNLPADGRTPFDNDYESQEVSQALIEGAEILAGDAAERLLADPGRRDAIVGCTPKAVHDEACFRQFVESFGRRALRRPLGEDEVAARLALLDYADQAADFYFAVGLAVRSFLEDPSFLYRIEIGEESSPGVFRLDGYAIASRLSYFLWATMPDDELFDLADQGALETVDAVRAQAERMLADPRALTQIERFHALWMGYDGLVAAGSLTSDMRAETDALFGKIVGEGRPWLDLFRWPETFVTPALAEHYGLEPPSGGGAAWVPYAESGRAGLLSQASFLAIGGLGEVTNPTTRGRLIRELLLCQTVPPPPKNVTPSFGGAESSVCKKDKYAAHVQGGCASCHTLMDGIGFGLEHYDATGAFRLNEPDDPATDQVDESVCALPTGGKLVTDEGAQPFDGPGELGKLLAANESFLGCASRQLYRFALGRSELNDVDEAVVGALLEGKSSEELRFDDLVVAIVSRESFLYRRDAAEEK